MLAVRTGLDAELQRAQPVKLGKPYPLGQCLEISKAFTQRLSSLDEASLPADAVAGLRAFRAFLRAGGIMRRVWGDLRGQYFQNAFQVGTLYVDVANDTVSPAKPKVEILPFDEAGLTPIRDFEHFSRIARVYWGHEVYPNHVLPELAPYCPLIHVAPDGVVTLRESSQYMLALTCSQGFAPSEAALRQASMPDALFARICKVLRKAGHAVPGNPVQGRDRGLGCCQEYRASRRDQAPALAAHVARQVWQLNLHLASISNEETMPIIKIEDKEYELDSLSAEARAQLANIRFVDQELARLQATMGALRTAREVYVNALKAALPPA